jgi:hypothetical protein
MTVSSYGAGGYLAGRLRRRTGHGDRDEVEARDGAHGLVVWAIGAIVGAMLTASGIGALGSAAASAAGTAAQAAGSAASGVASAATALVDESDLGYRVSSLFRGDAGGRVVDERVQAEVTSLFQRAVARGELAEQDRAYLAGLVAANTGLDQAAARQRIDASLAELEQARQAAVEAAEDARIAGVITGFFVAATLLVGAAAAYAAAVAGGGHRDENTAFTLFGASPRRVDVR